MSLPLRISLSDLPAQKLVFVQYLFSLAVVEACREDSVLGKWGEHVRVKWPNDLYIIGVGDANEERRKIGGVLVTTSFTGGNVDMVIGI
jgi:biotin--protein ligase